MDSLASDRIKQLAQEITDRNILIFARDYAQDTLGRGIDAEYIEDFIASGSLERAWLMSCTKGVFMVHEILGLNPYQMQLEWILSLDKSVYNPKRDFHTWRDNFKEYNTLFNYNEDYHNSMKHDLACYVYCQAVYPVIRESAIKFIESKR